MDIKGKTAVITGATGKLAAAIVLAMAKAGANCVCIYHKNSKKAGRLKAEPKRAGVKSLFIKADLTKPQNIEKVFAKIRDFSKPQILINAAAVFDKKPLNKITPEYIKNTLDINFTAAILMTKEFVKLAGKKKKAKIINITDAITEKQPAGFSVYSASKAALETATKTLAKELAPSITVNAISPGIIHKPKKITAKIATEKTAGVKKVLNAVKFIIENDSVTGQIINVDRSGDL
ncbi:MAG: SDR family NAD(P)-dependent oxidoreductase [Phycisphaerae bacterium]|nr:SDR family NAD(P)-dependent oxidoreductase [Phycisphaerae bacterium]